MKKFTFFAALALITAACSSPKQTANFQPQRSTGGYTSIASPHSMDLAPIESNRLTASVSLAYMTPVETPGNSSVMTDKPVRKTYLQMNKAERKNLRRQLKSELGKYVNSSKVNSTPREGWSKWDQDLKLAAIFGAVGTTGLIIHVEPFFIIGAIALIIGVVFLCKWLVRQ